MSSSNSTADRGSASASWAWLLARYLVSIEADGRLMFTPATVVPDIETRFLANTELLERIAANRSDPSRMIARRAP